MHKPFEPLHVTDSPSPSPAAARAIQRELEQLAPSGLWWMEVDGVPVPLLAHWPGVEPLRRWTWNEAASFEQLLRSPPCSW